MGSVTPQEIDTAIADAIKYRFDDHLDEWATLVYDRLIKRVLEYSEAKSRTLASGTC